MEEPKITLKFNLYFNLQDMDIGILSGAVSQPTDLFRGPCCGKLEEKKRVPINIFEELKRRDWK